MTIKQILSFLFLILFTLGCGTQNLPSQVTTEGTKVAATAGAIGTAVQNVVTNSTPVGFNQVKPTCVQLGYKPLTDLNVKLFDGSVGSVSIANGNTVLKDSSGKSIESTQIKFNQTYTPFISVTLKIYACTADQVVYDPESIK